MELEIEDLFGLPAHPLLVHAVVVLLPLAALATIVCALVRRARRPYAPIALGLAIAATLAAVLAQGSGEKLEEQVDETELVEAHTSQGEDVLPWAAGLTVAAAAVTAVPALERRRPGMSSATATAVVATLALVTGGGATYTVVRVGHSGARATWEEEVSGDTAG